MSDTPAPSEAPAPEATAASVYDILDRPAAEPETPAAEPEAPAAPAAEAAPPAPAAEPEASAAGTEGEPDVFPRTYVEELRQESAKYRTTAKTFTEAFEGYDDEARDAMLGIVRGLVESPETAAVRMVEVAKELLGDDFETALADGPKPLTQEDLEREFTRREQARQEEESVQAVMREARELGYADETPEAVMLYGIAAKFHSGDLKAADAFLKDLKQVAVDEYLAAKAGQADAFPPVAGGGVTAGSEREVKSFSDAKKGLMELLSN